MKKIAALLLTLMMVLNISACNNQTAEVSSATTADSTAAAETIKESTAAGSIIPGSLPAKKIGVAYSSFTDKIGSEFKAALESLEKPFNVEFQFIETTGGSQEQGRMAIDTALQSGLDGFMSVTISAADLETAQKAGNIPMIAFATAPEDDQAQRELAAFPNYLGCVVSSDYGVGQSAADALHEANCTKIGVCALTPGLSKIHDDRYQGFIDGIAKYPEMKIVAEDHSRAEYAKAIAAFAAAYPEMDGIFATYSNESVYHTIQTEGLVGRVKLASADLSDSTLENFENGTLVYIAAGQTNIVMQAFAILYNYLYDGTRIVPDAKPVVTSFIEMKRTDDCNNYTKYIEGSLPVYTSEEIASMIKGFNPNQTSEKFIETCQAYSLQDVITRHQDLVK